MEQVAVLAEETAASIAAAAAKRQSSTATTTTSTDADSDGGEGNIAVKPSLSISTNEQDDDMDTTPPVVITAQDRSTFEKIPYFKGISLADFDQVLSKVVPLTFQPGSIIVREGKPGRTFYVIKEGEVEICQKTNQRRAIESFVTSDPLVQPSVINPSNNLYIGTVVNRLGPGDFFGERALITGEPRAASLRVAESGPVTVWAFDKDTFPQSCVLSGKSRNTAVLSSKANSQFMDQVNTKYGVGLNITDTTTLDDTDEANLQQIIDEYQQHVMEKQLYEVSTASQIRGSIHKPMPIPETDADIEKAMEATPTESAPSTTDPLSGDSNDAIFSLLSRFQMIRHVSRCFRYIQESKTMLKWGDSGSRTRRNMLVQRLSKSRQLEYQDIFHIMDINKDGCIEVYELQLLMDSIGEPLKVQETMLVGASDCYESSATSVNADTCVSQGGMTYEDFMGLMAEAEFYYLFRDIFASLDLEDSGYVKARDLDRILCGVRDLISDDRKSIIDVEDKDMLIDYEQFSRMLLGTTLL
jgi:CRP-like cAMP-binding protein/Ca2+-binding EF-hand superfamily protein